MTKQVPHTSLYDLFARLYGNPQTEQHFPRLLALMERYKAKRPTWLKQLDEQPQWYQDNRHIGMTLYIDLFAGKLDDLKDKIAYFQTLGITYIHLMPFLKARAGNSDGGYAVEDYQAIDPKYGNLVEFESLVKQYFDAGIYVAMDFVINHTAKEHAWAQAALQGDTYYQQFYLMYDNEDIPNEFNKTVPEVLPDIYPGNFTYYESIKKFVFTSFSEFQWDLNFANPEVLLSLVDIFLFLSNLGVAMIRLDAIPFIWKELGTTCRNLPKVHDFMQIFQQIKQEVCPGMAVLGEAIVEPQEIVRYFGTTQAPECDVLYNAITMVNIWEALATRDGRLIANELKTYPSPKHATWMNYLRCHDDIGWGFNEAFIRDSGRDPFMHKQYLIQFYNGQFPSSFSRGQNYQENARTGDARTNGTLSALLGFEQACEYGNDEMIQRAFRRFELVHTLLYALPGMPLIYSGDEWLQANDYNHNKTPGKEDGRWVHRPTFNWDKVNHPEKYPLEAKAFSWLRSLNVFRKEEARLKNNEPMTVLPSDDSAVLVFTRGDNPLWCIFNFSEHPKMIHLPLPKGTIVGKDAFTKKTKHIFDGQCHLEGYEALLLTI